MMASSSSDATFPIGMLGRGGARQAASLAQSLEALADTQSVLVSRLLMLFGWGLLSANTVQWLAEGAEQDGLKLEPVKKLAGIGSHGVYSGNCRRDLLRQFCSSMSVAKPISVEVPLLSKLKTVFDYKVDFIAPTLLMESIWSAYPDMFLEMFGTNPKNFWQQVSPEDPKLKALQMEGLMDSSDWAETTYPYILHGDGAVFTKKNGNTLLTISMKSLITNKFGMSIVPLFTIPKICRTYTEEHNTTNALWAYVVHFLNAAFKGKHPALDPEGQPWKQQACLEHAGKDLCGGMKWVCWGITGDLEYLGNELNYPHFNSLSPCWFCGVSRMPATVYPMTDFSMNPAWKQTIVPFGEGCMVPVTDHAVSKLVGVTRFHTPGDLMHSGDLGVVQYLAGSVLAELLEEGPWVGREQDRLDQLWCAIRAAYGQTGCSNRLSLLKKEMFLRADDFPCLSAKAAESRSLLGVLRRICHEHHEGSDRDEHRLRALDHLCAMYSAYANGGMFLEPQVAETALHNFELFLLHYNWLLKFSLSKGVRRYGIYFKFHAMWHIADHAKWMNPCHTWCYDFEDFMAQMVGAAKACIAGSPMHLIGSKVLQNYLLVLELTLKAAC